MTVLTNLLEWAEKKLKLCNEEYNKYLDTNNFELLYTNSGRMNILEKIVDGSWQEEL